MGERFSLRILLTGGTGFLGRALARHFCNEGHEIALLLRPSSCLDRLGRSAEHFRIGRCATDAEVEAFIHAAHPDAVIHTACVYGRRGETIVDVADANLRLGLLILQGVLRLEKPVTFLNTGTVLAPDISPYALSKHQFAQWGRLVATQAPAKHLRFVSVLLQHMYGPGDDPSKFATHVLRACRRNDPYLALTEGGQRRDFIYIDDVVAAFSLLLSRAQELEPVVDIEVGTGTAPTIREFVETVHRLTGSRSELHFGALPYRPNEPMCCQADIQRLSKLGWAPVYGIEAGLKRMIELDRSS